jgi:hypothetical protein
MLMTFDPEAMFVSSLDLAPQVDPLASSASVRILLGDRLIISLCAPVEE